MHQRSIGPDRAPMLKRNERFFGQLVMTADVVTLVAGYFCAHFIRSRWPASLSGQLQPFACYAWVLWIITPTWACSFYLMGLYRQVTYWSFALLLKNLLKAQGFASLGVLSAMYLTRSEEISRLLLQTFILISFVMLALEKEAIRLILEYCTQVTQRRGLWRVVLVGSKREVEHFYRLQREQHWGCEVVRVVDPEWGIAGAKSMSARGSTPGSAFAISDWSEVLDRQVVDEVITACPWQKVPYLHDLARGCRERGIAFRVLVGLPPSDIGGYQIEDLGGGFCLASLEAIPQEPMPLLVKRMIDVAGGILGSILCALFYPLWAMCLWRHSPGPVLFRQTRIGQHGRRFVIYKFRTMRTDAQDRLEELRPLNQMNGLLFKLRDDPRVFPWGRLLRSTHLDELPQFWNVLRGEMSLVGTRPPTLDEVQCYEAHHHRRLSMKPGLTGLWQISGNGKVADFEEVVKLDCSYIDNWSVWLDSKILAATVVKVLGRSGW